MKDGWEYKKIGDICTKINGLWKGKKAPFVNVGVIRNANFTKDFTLNFSNIEYLDVESRQFATRQLQAGDIIVEKSGGSEKNPVGRAVLFEGRDGLFSFSNFTSVLRIKDDILLPRFFYLFLLHIYLRGDTRKMQKATTGIHNIEFEKYLNIDVPIPTISEQEEIVAFLDAEFAKIDAIKANAEKALQDAKDLFQAELNNVMTPKKGWNVDTLKDVCRVINGRAYLKPEMLESGKYRLLRVGNFFTNDKWYYTDMELADDKYCSEGDLLFAWSASFGPKIWHGEKVVYHYHIWKMVCEDVIDKDFMFYWLDSNELKNQTQKQLHGATMNHITKTIMENCAVAYPKDIAEQQQIAWHLKSSFSIINKIESNYRKTIALCEDMKQALLRQVFE